MVIGEPLPTWMIYPFEGCYGTNSKIRKSTIVVFRKCWEVAFRITFSPVSALLTLYFVIWSIDNHVSNISCVLWTDLKCLDWTEWSGVEVEWSVKIVVG